MREIWGCSDSDGLLVNLFIHSTQIVPQASCTCNRAAPELPAREDFGARSNLAGRLCVRVVSTLLLLSFCVCVSGELGLWMEMAGV